MRKVRIVDASEPTVPHISHLGTLNEGGHRENQSMVDFHSPEKERNQEHDWPPTNKSLIKAGLGIQSCNNPKSESLLCGCASNSKN